ncbi:IS3 family transposase, partial [Burkholderia ubonensis]|uniref:IS3 family transposase n=1 Tax=Burkholderia ubonensis TaxID=101571 RepID=UPI002AB37466
SKRCARAKRDEVLQPESKRVWQVNRPVCGVPKVWKQMSREGIAVARCTVGRLMKLQGLRGAVRGKHVRTTIADRSARFPVWFKKAQPTPFLAVVDTQTFMRRHELREEIFGPACIVVKVATLDETVEVLQAIEGSLTATIWGAESATAGN